MPNPENLIPGNKRTPMEARINGRKGGIKSVKVRREKKLLSEIYAEVIAELYQEDIKKGTGSKFIIKKILQRKDSSSVGMWRELRDATEGSKVKIQGDVTISRLKTMTDDELNKIIDG
jgi:hypothetical protein